MKSNSNRSLTLVPTVCCVCKNVDAEPVGSGYDFEYATSPDEFTAVRCGSCGLVYLNPRPDISEFEKIYPANYHAFDFSEKDFGLVYKVRARLEARRVLGWCRGLANDARIIDIGCGDGFHLGLLREFGPKNWELEGIDIDKRATRAAARAGIDVHYGGIGEVDLPENSYDLAFLIQTIEHVAGPDLVLRSVLKILKPGGRLVVVTDNTGSPDFHIFKSGHWGGYHFPRHWNLFDAKSISTLALNAGFELLSIRTQVSPVNWVYSIHNKLADKGRPQWLTDRFTLKSVFSLSLFTLLDSALAVFGRGALLNAVLVKPEEKI